MARPDMGRDMRAPDLRPSPDMRDSCAEEELRCDGLDDDCDGQIDEGCDDDGDGYCDADLTHAPGASCQPGDCDDTREDVHPGAPELCGSGVDQDCNGELTKPRHQLSVLQPHLGEDDFGPIEQLELVPMGTGGFGLFWLEERVLGARLRFQRLDALGGADGPPKTLSASMQGRPLGFDAVWNPTLQAFGLAWAVQSTTGSFWTTILDPQGETLGPPEEIALGQPFDAGFLLFLGGNVDLIATGDRFTMLYAEEFDGVYDTFARTLTPTDMRPGGTLSQPVRVLAGEANHSLSAAWVEDEGPSTGGELYLKRYERSVNSNSEAGTPARLIRLDPTEDPPELERKTVYYGSEYVHQRIFSVGSKLYALLFKPVEATFYGPDNELFIAELRADGNDERISAALASHFNGQSDFRILTRDDQTLEIVYRHRDDINTSGEYRVLSFDHQSFTPVSLEQPFALPTQLDDYTFSPSGLFFEPAMGATPGRYQVMVTRDHDAPEELPERKLAILNENQSWLTEAPLLGEPGLEPGQDFAPFDPPRARRGDTRYLPDGSFEWVENQRVDVSGETRYKTIVHTLTPDLELTHSPRGLHELNLRPLLLKEELIAITTLSEVEFDADRQKVLSCSSDLRWAIWDSPTNEWRRHKAALETLVYERSGGRETCSQGRLDRNNLSMASLSSGRLAALVLQPASYDEQSERVRSELELWVLEDGEVVSIEPLGAKRSSQSSRFLELPGGTHLVLHEWTTSGESEATGSPRQVVAYRHVSAEGVVGPEQTLALPEGGRFEEESEVYFALEYLSSTWSQGDPWLFFTWSHDERAEIFTTPLPSSPSDLPGDLLQLGEIELGEGEEFYTYFLNRAGSRYMLTAGAPAHSEGTGKAYAILFDSETRESTGPEMFIESDTQTYNWLIPFLTQQGHHWLTYVGKQEQRVYLVDDALETLSQENFPVTLPTFGSIPPFEAFYLWSSPEHGGPRWPLWQGNSTQSQIEARRLLNLDMWCD